MDYVLPGRPGLKISRFILGTFDHWRDSNYSGWALAKTAMVASGPGFVAPVAHLFWHRAMWGMDWPTLAARIYLEGKCQRVGT